MYVLLLSAGSHPSFTPGITGYAFLQLYEVAPSLPNAPRYLAKAIHHARVLAATQVPGDSQHAPWPFRVDSISGKFLNGRKNGDSVFPLRLFRSLAAPPYNLTEFAAPASSLYHWIVTYQLPTANANVTTEAALFVNFFEDRTTLLDNNRNSWTAMELARYLIEERDSLDLAWMQHVESIVAYSLALFGAASGVANVTLLGGWVGGQEDV
jgi:hypothetical protein